MADQDGQKPTSGFSNGAVDVPDPDDDDLDDLDEVLDEFKATKLEAKPSADTKHTGSSKIPSATLPESNDERSDVDDDEFAKQLQAGMAELLGDMDKDPVMKKQFEELLQGLGAGATAVESKTANPGPTDPANKPKGQKTGEDSFQETIRKTMERMQESGEQASAAATSSSQDDMLAQMLKEMEKSGLGSSENDGDFSKMLLGMMEQLTNKDILYEPMKELNDKFPTWMMGNREKLDKGDLGRYEEQQKLVSEIVARFEESDYSDEKAEDREYIVERMQKMQAAGAPPPDLVGDMNATQEALGDMDAQCPQQ
ncbi:MAG: Peroxisome chaperone and import receptor [Bathelium mastoideum]|nr:MAG: Peroxisome chaperone and import receptor [Bathelium mastoideum]